MTAYGNGLILLMEASIFSKLKIMNNILLDFIVSNKSCEKHGDK
jgi:hypothetical protein